METGSMNYRAIARPYKEVAHARERIKQIEGLAMGERQMSRAIIKEADDFSRRLYIGYLLLPYIM